MFYNLSIISKILICFCIIFISYHASANIPISEQSKFIDHETWLIDPLRQKPPLLSDEEINSWKPPFLYVDSGIHIINLYDLNHKDQRYGLKADIWFQWSGDQKFWDGSSSDYFGGVWVNSIYDEQFTYYENNEPYIDINDNRSSITGFDGFLNSNFDYTKFPFDNQVLEIQYEAAMDAYHVILNQKDKPSAEPNFNKILDYSIESIEVENKLKVYPTAQGVTDYEDGETKASSIVIIKLNLKKSFINSFFLYIFPLVTIAFILLINSSKFSTDKSIKLSLPPATLIALIFLQKESAKDLPALNYLTYIDYLYILSYFLIFICFLEAMLSYKINNTEERNNEYIYKDLVFKLIVFSTVFIAPLFIWILINR